MRVLATRFSITTLTIESTAVKYLSPIETEQERHTFTSYMPSL